MQNVLKLCFSIQQSVNEIVNQFKPAADLKDLDIDFSSDLDMKETVNLDRTLFETSVRNLLDNALKYAVSETTVKVKLTKKFVSYELTIQNKFSSGPFLDQRQLFKKFKRGEKTREIIGSGLGLSIVQEAINAIGGTVEIKKNKGDIICATFILPC